MRSKFPGYFIPFEDELKSFWQTATFSIDANVLLNLYRYSDDTRDELFKILESFKERLWISHQAALEFFEGKLEVIAQQEKAYDSIISELKTVESKFKNSRQHPFLSQTLLSKLSSTIGEIEVELRNSKEVHAKRIVFDEIMHRVANLIGENVGSEFDKEELQALVLEGKERYAKRIPPGFKDAGKDLGHEQSIKQYGDLIIWKQLISKARTDQVNIIFITDDRKEDWWVKFQGKTLGARPELVKEFEDNSKKCVLFYQTDKFMESVKKYFPGEIKENAIQEVREIRKQDEAKFWDIFKHDLIETFKEESNPIDQYGRFNTTALELSLHMNLLNKLVVNKAHLESLTKENRELLSKVETGIASEVELKKAISLQGLIHSLQEQNEDIYRNLKNVMDNFTQR